MNDSLVIGVSTLWLLFAGALILTLVTSLVAALYANRDPRLPERKFRARMLASVATCLTLDLGVVIAAWQLGEASFARNIILLGLLPYSLWVFGIPLAFAHFTSEK